MDQHGAKDMIVGSKNYTGWDDARMDDKNQNEEDRVGPVVVCRLLLISTKAIRFLQSENFLKANQYVLQYLLACC